MKPITQNSELISALADGQLENEDFARALAVCEGDAQALDSWSTYHLIGDVLRSPGAMAPGSDAAFVTRLRVRLSQEPVYHAAPAPAVQASSDWALQAEILPAGRPAREAVNDASFRWKMIAGFVSIAAVVAVTWNVGTGLLAPSVAPQLARAEPSQQVLVMSEQGAVVRDARMEELLAAHKQFGGTSALQMPSGFLRNATFETPQSERR
ncbi:sigma-E factor negative regulatory protein [Polaromonas sp. UC242_47]|uniref:sigma-E factor negative regulatory protein n=1 Tax=Polaromonas sp. UC242_47 TaxID=3374626 RepID=UPI00379612FB